MFLKLRGTFFDCDTVIVIMIIVYLFFLDPFFPTRPLKKS